MSSRDQILSSIRSVQLPEVALPALDGPWSCYDDRRGRFCEVLHAVGGQAVIVQHRAELNDRLQELAAFRDAKVICSLVDGVGRADVDLATIADPHELATVDFGIVAGEFAVAENGAVWIIDDKLAHRVLPFIAQHLAIVVPASEIVDHMHAAYARLCDAQGVHDAGVFAAPWFGVFISGPSKTADIEQSLVIGAHGARSLTVFLLENW